MTRTGKTLTVIAALMATVVVGWLLLIGAVVAIGGVATVELVDRSGGVDLYIPVPMALVDVALASAATPIVHTAGFPTVQVDGVRVDLGEIGPMVVGLFDELDDLPDVTLVQVEDESGSVRISKVDGKLLIEVEDPGTSLGIAVPTRGAARLAGRLLR